MVKTFYKDIGRDRIDEIFRQGGAQVDFIENVFREWVKLNQFTLNDEYARQQGIARKKDDIDQFSLWLVDNIYLQVYCKRNDNAIVKDFCIHHYGYKST